MTARPTNRLLCRLHRVALRPECGVTDAQLLERFLARRDEGAFEELVRRHGPMVLGVCRRVLGEPHDAADAFQATFLVLVRRAAAIVPRSRVGPWLYGVARRTALKLRSAAARRRRAEQHAGRGRAATTPAVNPADDLRPLLDEELGRLPQKYCAPLVLCLLQGKSRKEAARLLGWSEGTLSGRLARAKELLGHRLRRRGVVPACAALAAALAESAAGAPIPACLAVATLKAAASLGGPAAACAVSAPVIALTEEVLKAMLTSKLKAVAGLVVLVAGIGIGAGAVARQYGPPSRSAALAEGYSDAKPAAVHEKDNKPQGYVIEPPDMLRVEYGRLDSADPVKITGQRLVRPDGSISLGQLGSVFVAGRTAEEARDAIAEHLAGRLDGFDRKKLTVEVAVSNSKFFYVIADDADGSEQIYRLPATGIETVLDAIVQVKGALVGIGRKHIYVRRLAADGKDGKVLQVDWKAITHDGDAATNHTLRPGDRVFIKGIRPPKKATGATRMDDIFVNVHNFNVPFALDQGQRPDLFDRVVLFVSEDEGRSYQQAATAPAHRKVVPVSVEHDGTYWLVVQVRRRDGRLEPGEVTSAKPSLKVCVDTKPPEARIWHAEVSGGTFDFGWEVRDANLDIDTLALEYRPAGPGAWSRLAIPKDETGRRSFTLPEAFFAGPVELRLSVRDRAGNVGKAEMTLR
jgi:RNA polymerase sigma factor (sigma-70 family)